MSHETLEPNVLTFVFDFPVCTPATFPGAGQKVFSLMYKKSPAESASSHMYSPTLTHQSLFIRLPESKWGSRQILVLMYFLVYFTPNPSHHPSDLMPPLAPEFPSGGTDPPPPHPCLHSLPVLLAETMGGIRFIRGMPSGV